MEVTGAGKCIHVIDIPSAWGLERQTPDGKGLADRAVFDGRNIWEPDSVRAAGLRYYSIGRG